MKIKCKKERIAGSEKSCDDKKNVKTMCMVPLPKLASLFRYHLRQPPPLSAQRSSTPPICYALDAFTIARWGEINTVSASIISTIP